MDAVSKATITFTDDAYSIAVERDTDHAEITIAGGLALALVDYIAGIEDEKVRAQAAGYALVALARKA